MNGNAALLIGLVLAGGTGFLASWHGFGTVPPFVPVLAILVIAWPSFWALMQMLGKRQGLTVLALLGGLALFVEMIGVLTGYPYGSFNYTGDLGWQFFALVPWTVPFAWVPLLLGSISLSFVDRFSVIRCSLRAAALLTLMDFVLDPGAVSVGLWRYANPGAYHDVPWTNFAGWLLVGFVASMLLIRFVRSKTLVPELSLSAAWMMAFWTAVSLARGLWIPCFIGLFLVIFISYRYTRRSRATRIL